MNPLSNVSALKITLGNYSGKAQMTIHDFNWGQSFVGSVFGDPPNSNAICITLDDFVAREKSSGST
jgi:hypothetical protein